MMEIQEGESKRSNDQTHVITRGKRTKRHRQPSPLRLTMCSTSTSASSLSSAIEGSSDGIRINSRDSPSVSAELAADIVTEEEEDMANCLILLAQGNTQKHPEQPMPISIYSNKRGVFLYQCKTCNRCFPSFQALGGHRASHKKPKGDTTTAAGVFVENRNCQFNGTNTTLSLQLLPNRPLSSTCMKTKVHECSICRAEFSSGQALGGHMRRHRTFVNTTSSPDHQLKEIKEGRNTLKLDLNLPALPEDHHKEAKLPFGTKEQLIVFSASAMVDCHY